MLRLFTGVDCGTPFRDLALELFQLSTGVLTSIQTLKQKQMSPFTRAFIRQQLSLQTELVAAAKCPNTAPPTQLSATDSSLFGEN